MGIPRSFLITSMFTIGLVGHLGAFTICSKIPTSSSSRISGCGANYITLCKESELTTCGLESARAAFPHLLKGNDALRLPSVDPLHLKEIRVVSDSSRNMKINITFTDLIIEGISTSEIETVSIKNIGNVKRLKLVASPKYINLKSHYKTSGQILVFPIIGEGPCEIHIEKPTLTYELDLKIKKVKGENRVMFVNLYTSQKAKKGIIRLDNLFNGNKVLGDNMNRVLNENWEALEDQVGSPLLTATTNELIPFFLTVFNDVPYSNLFKE